jgi:protease-4
LGLVDKIGGISDAIAFAADEANLEEYDVRIIPRPKSFVELLMADLQEEDNDENTLSLALRNLLPGQTSLVDALIPRLQALEPQRLRSVMIGLAQLQQLDKERVLMAMPIITIRDDR